ncbi:MAG: sterol desaturase family protein [Nitriliruptor sp.]|uniref:sterol desaturase family protein n=1 Tax=Nitriliruptor sp. TaxID=2448056 RepID=UPI0034A06207
MSTTDATTDVSTGPRREPGRPPLTLGRALRTFVTRPQPWLLAAAAATALSWRLLLGGFGWSDLLVVAGYLAAFPFVEWVAHTSLLHWRPRQVGGRTIDPLVARKHREHHADPEDLDLILLPLPALLSAAGAVALVAWLIPSDRLGLTFASIVTAVGLAYEWIHYLVHTEYRPRSAPYRAIWRHHRLHHYKNENYWFTVTTASTADRVLGTQPAPNEVSTSPTVRDLLGSGR